SYRFVERPIRERIVGRFVETWRQTSDAERKPLLRRAAMMALPAAAMATIALVALATMPAVDANASVAPDVARAMGIQDGGPTRGSLRSSCCMSGRTATSRNVS